MSKIKLLLLVVLSGWASVNYAQNDDFLSLFKIEFEKELSKKVDVSIGNEIRFGNNSTQFFKNQTLFGGEYKVTKQFDIGIGYRYISLPNNEPNNHQYNIDGAYAIDIKRFELQYRSRFQSRYSPENKPDFGKTMENIWRNRIRLEYNIRKSPFSPYLSTEVFYPLNDYRAKYLNKYRIEAAVNYKIDKSKSLRCFYRLQQPMNETSTDKIYLLGLIFNYSL